jgi:hypothetical protein
MDALTRFMEVLSGSIAPLVPSMAQWVGSSMLNLFGVDPLGLFLTVIGALNPLIAVVSPALA